MHRNRKEAFVVVDQMEVSSRGTIDKQTEETNQWTSVGGDDTWQYAILKTAPDQADLKGRKRKVPLTSKTTQRRLR